MHIHSDAIVFVYSLLMVLIGFILGRYEKTDSYTKGYKRGKEVGWHIGYREADEYHESK